MSITGGSLPRFQPHFNHTCKIHYNYVETSTPSQHSGFQHNNSARQPVSCEPCRHRKIKSYEFVSSQWWRSYLNLGWRCSIPAKIVTMDFRTRKQQSTHQNTQPRRPGRIKHHFWISIYRFRSSLDGRASFLASSNAAV